MTYRLITTLLAVALLGLLLDSPANAQNEKQLRAEKQRAEELEIEKRIEADIEALQKRKQKLKKEKQRGADGEDDDFRLRGAIEINGKKIELDEEKLEAWLEENGEELEEWAEKYADSWEKWAEKFEYKMERWAESQEKVWEDWAENYSERWEDWGEKLESGEIQPYEIGELVERNLEMLSEMPLGQLIDGALKEGLGELKNAPFDSLGELNELVGGALEQSLQAMEKEIAHAAETELKEILGKLKTKDLHGALSKLQHAIDAKQKKHDFDAAGNISQLEELLKKQKNLGAKERAKILAELKREFADARLIEQEASKTLAKEAYWKALQGREEQQVLQHELRAKAEAMKARDMAKAAEIAVQRKHALAQEKLTLELYYADLKKQKEALESKESDIDLLRREIMELRKEVERMKKQAGKKKD